MASSIQQVVQREITYNTYKKPPKDLVIWGFISFGARRFCTDYTNLKQKIR
jgi:hypothetical protein